MSAVDLPWTEDERNAFIAAARAAISGPRAEDAAANPARVPAPKARGVLNAGMSLTSILASLSRIGWGPLRGREFAASRAILDTLAILAHDTRADLAAVVQTTARQLAKRSGYSLRHTSRCLQWLEDAGVIVWHRGGIRMGTPTVGVVKIVKRVLVDWVLSFRKASDAEDNARNAETRARIQLYRLRRNSARPRPLTAHVDMATPLPSLQEEGAAKATPRPSCEAKIPHRKDTDVKYRPSYMKYLATTCTHGVDSPDRCNQCKYQAIMRQQQAAEAERAAAERRRKEEEESRHSDNPEAVFPPAYVEYMHATYPDAHYRSWARLNLSDPKAKELMLNA
nr:MAG TPA: winged helix-turn-helix DNA-binding protein [Caudoviricetes sp.]